ncbi:peroxidase 6-like [Impatiens glandulifera]|uniref:peroxidase 6-like n=1 Tax=Impatiens glandulifera TaxID=253017 RepID=UPI001FB1810D|nr:peroxidase 6-like [Impatiens glandulifera]
MDAPLLLPVLLLLLSASSFATAKLSENYYAKTCPDFLNIMQDVVFEKQRDQQATAAAALRIFFHDCMVTGCDASILIAPMEGKPKVEKDADINEALSGDGFDVIIRAKMELEMKCPGTVSCADIIAVAARTLVKMVGGPYYKVLLGRKDGFVSQASLVEGNLARSNFSMDTMIKMFEAKGYTIEDMVALVGAHTIGFTHCKEFANRIWDYKPGVQTDPTLNPKYAKALRRLCANYTTNPGKAAFNDPFSAGTFDNQYYKNLLNGLGLMTSDTLLAMDHRTRPIVVKFAKSQKAFFAAFTSAMEKTGQIGVKTGKNGEVRDRCDRFNLEE